MSLSWEACPYCGECADTHRVGKPVRFYVQGGKWHSKLNLKKRCGFCGKTWSSKEPTMKEAMGFDGEEDTAV